jgi:hypothetical protein
MLKKKLQDRSSSVGFVGIAMGFIGGVAGLFSDQFVGALVGLTGGLIVGVCVGVVLVALYAEGEDEYGESVAGVPQVNAGPLSMGMEE